VFRLLACTVLDAGCAEAMPYGVATPTRDICAHRAVDQRLPVANDFTIVRKGDDQFPSDASVRKSLAADAAAVQSLGSCPGDQRLGEFVMTVRRIEVGSSRQTIGKVLSWTLLLLPTLGVSSAYPLTEERWMTIELDARATMDHHDLWSGEFTAHVKGRALAGDLPSAGSQVTALMKKAQTTAAAELKAQVKRAAR
jgi:hypothetical protein